MPYVRIEMLAGRSDDQKAAIAQAVTDALVQHGGATAGSVTLVFEDVAAANWAVGGELVARRAI